MVAPPAAVVVEAPACLFLRDGKGVVDVDGGVGGNAEIQKIKFDFAFAFSQCK